MADSSFEKENWKHSRRDHRGKVGEVKKWKPAPDQETQNQYRKDSVERGQRTLRKSGAEPGDYAQVTYWLGRDLETGARLGEACAEGVIGFYTKGSVPDSDIFIWTKGKGKVTVHVHTLNTVTVLKKYAQ